MGVGPSIPESTGESQMVSGGYSPDFGNDTLDPKGFLAFFWQQGREIRNNHKTEEPILITRVTRDRTQMEEEKRLYITETSNPEYLTNGSARVKVKAKEIVHTPEHGVLPAVSMVKIMDKSRDLDVEEGLVYFREVEGTYQFAVKKSIPVQGSVAADIEEVVVSPTLETVWTGGVSYQQLAYTRTRSIAESFFLEAGHTTDGDPGFFIKVASLTNSYLKAYYEGDILTQVVLVRGTNNATVFAFSMEERILQTAVHDGFFSYPFTFHRDAISLFLLHEQFPQVVEYPERNDMILTLIHSVDMGVFYVYAENYFVNDRSTVVKHDLHTFQNSQVQHGPPKTLYRVSLQNSQLLQDQQVLYQSYYCQDKKPRFQDLPLRHFHASHFLHTSSPQDLCDPTPPVLSYETSASDTVEGFLSDMQEEVLHSYAETEILEAQEELQQGVLFYYVALLGNHGNMALTLRPDYPDLPPTWSVMPSTQDRYRDFSLDVLGCPEPHHIVTRFKSRYHDRWLRVTTEKVDMVRCENFATIFSLKAIPTNPQEHRFLPPHLLKRAVRLTPRTQSGDGYMMYLCAGPATLPEPPVPPEPTVRGCNGHVLTELGLSNVTGDRVVGLTSETTCMGHTSFVISQVGNDPRYVIRVANPPVDPAVDPPVDPPVDRYVTVTQQPAVVAARKLSLEFGPEPTVFEVEMVDDLWVMFKVDFEEGGITRPMYFSVSEIVNLMQSVSFRSFDYSAVTSGDTINYNEYPKLVNYYPTVQGTIDLLENGAREWMIVPCEINLPQDKVATKKAQEKEQQLELDEILRDNQIHLYPVDLSVLTTSGDDSNDSERMIRRLLPNGSSHFLLQSRGIPCDTYVTPMVQNFWKMECAAKGRVAPRLATLGKYASPDNQCEERETFINASEEPIIFLENDQEETMISQEDVEKIQWGKIIGRHDKKCTASCQGREDTDSIEKMEKSLRQKDVWYIPNSAPLYVTGDLLPVHNKTIRILVDPDMQKIAMQAFLPFYSSRRVSLLHIQKRGHQLGANAFVLTPERKETPLPELVNVSTWDVRYYRNADTYTEEEMYSLLQTSTELRVEDFERVESELLYSIPTIYEKAQDQVQLRIREQYDVHASASEQRYTWFQKYAIYFVMMSAVLLLFVFRPDDWQRIVAMLFVLASVFGLLFLIQLGFASFTKKSIQQQVNEVLSSKEGMGGLLAILLSGAVLQIIISQRSKRG